MRRTGGTTLMELIVAMSLLSALIILLFSAFELGTRVFRDTLVRQSAENQLRSIKLLLERDANHTNFWYCNEVSRPDTDPATGESVFRDGLSIATLDKWDEPTNYDPLTRRPQWNRYVVWYATLGGDGSLYRQVVEPGAPPQGFTAAYGALASNLSNDPDLNSDVVFSRILSDNVIDFDAGLRFQNGTVNVTIQLRAEGAQRAQTLQKTRENLEVDFTFQPKNNWPPI